MSMLDLPRAEVAVTVPQPQIDRRARVRRMALGGALALISLPLGLGSLELLAQAEGSWGYLGVVGFAAALALDLLYARRLCNDADWE